MIPYYPLGLRSKVELINFGFIPRKNFSKRKRELQCGNDIQRIFKELYVNLKNRTNNCNHLLLKEPFLPNIIRVLKDIIPKRYFGTRANKKKLFFIIKRILTQTRGEFIHVCTLYEGYEYDDISWLNRSQHSNQNLKDQLLWANMMLMQTVVKPLIRYFYFYVNTLRNREFQVVPIGQLHSFVDRNIDKHIKMGYIRNVEKESKRLSRGVSVYGNLRFVPKKSLKDLDCRVLVLMSANAVKYPIDSIKNNLKLLIQKYQIGLEKSLYEKWKRLVEYNKNRRKLFAVKLDLLDAFGMVDLEVLKTIIKEDDKFLTDAQKELLYNIISFQYVHIKSSKHNYQWCHGLLQGTNLSPILCELYLSYLVFKHLGHYHKPNTLLHRTVDDILFVSTCDNDVYEFELEAMKVFTLNNDKHEVFVNAGEDPHIIYCGKVFNMVTRETSNLYSFKKDTELRIMFKFWNVKYPIAPNEPHKFLTNSIKYKYVNLCFSPFELNTTCNSVDMVLKNIYQGMCYVAFKMVCAVESIDYVFKNWKSRCKIVEKVVNFVLATYCPKIKKTIEKFKGDKHEDIFATRLLMFITLRAFIVVLKRHSKYRYVIDRLTAKSKKNGRLRINNVDYFFKLPKQFENIKTQRKQKCL